MLCRAPTGEDNIEAFQMTHPSIDMVLPCRDHMISVIAILPKIEVAREIFAI